MRMVPMRAARKWLRTWGSCPVQSLALRPVPELTPMRPTGTSRTMLLALTVTLAVWAWRPVAPRMARVSDAANARTRRPRGWGVGVFGLFMFLCVCAQGKAVAGARRGGPEEWRGGSRRVGSRKLEGRRAGETEAGETEGRKSGGVVTRRSRRWHGDHGGGGGGRRGRRRSRGRGGSFSFFFIVLFLWFGCGGGGPQEVQEARRVGVGGFCVLFLVCGLGWLRCTHS